MKTRNLKTFIILSQLSFFQIVLFAQGTEGSWVTLSSSGFTARKGLTSAVVNGKIYTICGIGNNGLTNTFINTLEVFDPLTNSWSTPKTTGAATARYLLTSAVVNNKIYVLGGTDGTDIATLEIFDPANNTWVKQTTTGTFTPRAGLTSSVIGNKIYVIGGENNFGPLNTLEVFDPATNAWSTPSTTGTFLPTSKLTSSVVGDKIYVMGGYDGSTDLNTLEVFDPSANIWSTPMTTGTFSPRDNLTSSVLSGKIYVIGGFDQGQAVNTVEVFDPTTNVWSTPTTKGALTARSELTSSVVNGEIYTIGGISGTIKSTNEVFSTGGTSVRAESVDQYIQLFPNPTAGVISVLSPNMITQHITVTTILGKKVLELEDPYSAEFTLDLSKCSPGVYYVKFASARSVITKMVIR